MSSNVVWVQMTITISGGRADGRNWPDRWGAAIDLPAIEAWPLIRAGNAIEVPAPAGAKPMAAPVTVSPGVQSAPAQTAAGPITAGSGDGAVSFTPAEGGVSDETDPVPAMVGPGEVIGPAWEITDEPVPVRERPDYSADELAPPKPAAPKSDWVDYAMAHGETEDSANMQTKAGLMSKYGGRL